MTNLQEIARLVREELLTLIRPVQLLSVNPKKATGEVSGRFKSNGILFDYSIQGGTVTYRPVGAGGGRSDSADHVVEAGARLDAARGKPRNCTTGYACGNTCIQKGRKCRAKGGAAAAKLEQAVKMLPAAGQSSGEAAPQRTAAPKKNPAAAPAAKASGKGPSLKEAKSAVLEAFDVESVAALKADDEFKMSMAGEETNPLRSKEDWLKLYRRFVKVPENERNLPDGPTVVNGIDVIKNFRPWAVFGLNPRTATADNVRSRFRELIMQHHPDKGGDPRVAERLKKMRDSMLAFMPNDRRAGSRSDADLSETAELVRALRVSQQSLRHRWSTARADGYQEALERLDAAKKNCSTGYGCGSTCIEVSKLCRKKGGRAAKKLSEAVSGGGASRPAQSAAQREKRIAALNARRNQIGADLVTALMRPRPDGQGNYIENPDAAAMQRIRRAKKRVAEIDAELNVLEGKDPKTKRWIEGDPYGLQQYSDFQSPGRRAYEENVIIPREMSGAEVGDQAVFMSGGPASGKTSLLKARFGEAEGFVTIDPDRLKDYDPVMAIGVAMGMREAAALAHENSSRLAKEIYARARDGHFNIVVDGTGAKADKYIEQMEELKGKGYGITLLAQHIPKEEGVKRAEARADRTGRFVPLKFIAEAYDIIPGNFERLARVAGKATLNDGESGEVIMEYQDGRLVGGNKQRISAYRKQYGQPKR